MSTTTTLSTFATAFAISAVVALAPVSGAVAAKPAKTNVPGNNGTIKVHEKDTPARTQSNDPKVCVFNFEGYGFDKGQAGVIALSVQGGGNDRSIVKEVSMPAANAGGYTETDYITMPNGHYKTTVYGKDVHGAVDYDRSLKAKSKVIKVDCPNPEATIPVVEGDVDVPTPQTPTTPAADDPQVIADNTTKDEPTHKGVVTVAAANTAREVKGAGAALPETVAQTGASNSYLALLATLLLGAGTYFAALYRRQ